MVEISDETSNRSRIQRDILGALAIFVMVLAVYAPALRGAFIWDDDANVTKNVPLRSLSGLARIWVEPGATQQYYPLTHTSFWLDYHAWGLQPWGYHLENLLLHALSAVLLWRLLRRLNVPAPWFCAALFAVHPVCVESVAWITERKNTLSGVFYVAAALAAIEYWLPSAPAQPGRAPATPQTLPVRFGATKFYWLSVVLYLCALWGKTATIGLPAVILLLAWWKRGWIVRRDFVLLLPFAVCALGLAAITIRVEHHLVVLGGGTDDWRLSPVMRLLVGGRALWFYLEKIVWPHPLMFMYPRWDIQPTHALDYLPLAAVIGVAAFLWSRRHAWGRPALFALGSFFLVLFPVLGAFNVFFYRYSFVCDHFQYLALIGPLVLITAGFATALKPFARSSPFLKPALSAVVLAAAGVLTWQHCKIFQNQEILWRDSLAHNPDSWMAHDNLGSFLSQAGRFSEADAEYQSAIALRPDDHVAYYDLGLECALRGQLDQAAAEYKKALEISPSFALADYELANIFAREGKLDDAIQDYHIALETYPDFAIAHFNLANAFTKKGDLDDAIPEYRTAIKLEPDFVLASVTLGNTLAKKGDLDGALMEYNQALAIQPTNAALHTSLARALAAKGRVDDAIVQFRKALEIDPDSVDAQANLGNALLHQGHLDDAIALYRSALRLSPTSATLHYNLGVALSRQGKTEESQAEVNEARRLQAEHEPVK